MSSDQWIFDDIEEAKKPGNEALYHMIHCFMRGSQIMENEPEEALILFKDGRMRAEALQKTWWVLFFDHWQIQTLMYTKRDYDAAHELVVKATVDARKPALAECPTRVCVHEDLIAVYQGRDPLGYSDQIEDAIQYMEDELTPDSNCYFCLRGRRIGFEMAHGRTDKAKDEAMHYLSIAEGNNHYRVHALGDLCEIALIEEDWDAMLTWATEGKPLAIEQDRREWAATFMAWQLLAHHKLGADSETPAILNMLSLGARFMRPITSGDYYDALCTYHESSGDLAEALRLREQEIEIIGGKGQYHHECEVRLKVCRLLKKLGKPLDADIQMLRDIVANLKKPEKFLKEIDALTAK